MNEKERTMYKREFNERAYDRISVTVPKGQKKAIDAHAKQHGVSINGLVNILLRTDMGLTEVEWREPDKKQP